MKTVSINVMSLCVPCANRCRYCLLSYDGRTTGASFERSAAYAKRFYDWLKLNRPELSFLFGFGYSMEHPDLIRAIKFCQSTGSATGEFLQLDGMGFRTEEELDRLISDLKANGIRLINLTFYGTEEYHDRFAARKGDFRLIMNTLRAANKAGLPVSVGIPLTQENAVQTDALLTQLEEYRTERIFCFVPHCEGRGASIESIRLTSDDYKKLSDKVRSHLNRNMFRPECEWVRESSLPKAEKRVLTLNLTPENIGAFEAMDFAETIAYLESLDDAYYSAMPSFEELIDMYADPEGKKMYSTRDLYMRYQKRYIAENNIDIYDINDERQHCSRRF